MVLVVLKGAVCLGWCFKASKLHSSLNSEYVTIVHWFHTKSLQSFNDLFLLLSGCYFVLSVARWAPRICRLYQGRRWLYLESWSIELTSSGWWCRSRRWLRDCISCTSSSPAAWRSISSVYTWAPTRTPLDVRGESVELPFPTLLGISRVYNLRRGEVFRFVGIQLLFFADNMTLSVATGSFYTQPISIAFVWIF